MKEHKKLERLPFAGPLISHLVPEALKILRSKQKCGHETRKSIKINKNQSKLTKFVTLHTLLVNLMNN